MNFSLEPPAGACRNESSSHPESSMSSITLLDLPVEILDKIYRLVFERCHLSSIARRIDESIPDIEPDCLPLSATDQYRSNVHGLRRACRRIYDETQGYFKYTEIELTCDWSDCETWEKWLREPRLQTLVDRVVDLSIRPKISPTRSLIWWNSLRRVRCAIRTSLDLYAERQHIKFEQLHRGSEWQSLFDWSSYGPGQPAEACLGLRNRLDSFSASVLWGGSIPLSLRENVEEHPEIQGLCRYQRCDSDQSLSDWTWEHSFCILVSCSVPALCRRPY